MNSTCQLGYYNSTAHELDPLTAANDGEDPGEEVTLSINSGLAATISGFETEVTYQGQVVVENTINDTTDAGAGASPFSLPYFLTPGHTFTALIDLVTLANTVNESTATYLHSECSVVTWYHP
jgi:hypothetical protein